MISQKSDTALLVMDMQEALLAGLPGSDQLFPQIAAAIKHARETGIPVIYCVAAFRKGYPEIHPDHKSFRTLPSRLPDAVIEQMMKIVPPLAPANEEVVVVKKRYSAFTGSDLEVVLRSNGIRHLVLAGVITSGVVLSTLTEAADKDYRLTVLSDGCMDRDQEVHQILVERVFPKVADVCTCEEWTKK
ncbi:cysteine hydrolase family protein [Chitinophaga qingshengii]|uniref:Cysteine hydrolase n=1 Tax=Chitinophaga qingshengii TaxID=1569794 RepID=A0ABR7TRL9_9BACT|nr:isochorismatase family cysteine hydrolase [Chitinophaga qingshengii]MBC9933141.1 cysteine hydrolase [Chitinophaga qingshengii]